MTTGLRQPDPQRHLAGFANGPCVRTVCDIIAGQPFFKGLSAKHCRALADNAKQTWFEADELIFRDGDLANRFYLVVDGAVALELSTNGRPVLLQSIGAGELLGWSWMFLPYVRHLQARAIEPAEAILFYGTRLREQCEKDHDLGYELFRRVAEVMMQRLQSARNLLLEQHCPKVTAGRDWRPGQH
jgi:CRP/FNR family cyclic AMP-dependent transcriptional regulator